MTDAIVIGSGIGGLAAAKVLIEAGKKVIVLEASNVVGGRLNTQNATVGKQPFNFEHGASWIYGSSEDNPITKLTNEVPGFNAVETDENNYEIYDYGNNDIIK